MNMLFLMNKRKDQISWVSSHDLYWENKMYKGKRSIVGCVWFMYRKMELRYWLVLGNVKNNRIN